MKQRILFEGQLGDDSIDKVLPGLIAKAKELKEDVFLIWNSATLRITETDTVDTLMHDYFRELHAMTLCQQEKAGELVTKYELKKRANGLIEQLFK